MMFEPRSKRDITDLLIAWTSGREEALAELLPRVYDELRRLAASRLRHERADHTLQPTALVHEAYLRLIDQRRMKWRNRGQFYAIAAQIMRRILVDHARAQHADKRGGDWTQVSIDTAMRERSTDVDLTALDEALVRLAAVDPQQAKIVELRYFGGLTIDETADALNISPATVSRDWTMARAWLRHELRR